MRSNKLKEFIKEIQFKNRNPRDNSVLELLDDIATNPEMLIKSGDYLYRSRVVGDPKEMGREQGFYGYGKKESFIAPWEKAADMRANYRYIPYLYCTNDRYVSVLEVRPRLGAAVSVAKIEALEDLTLLDFTMRQTPRGMKDVKKNLFDDLSELFSKPITKDDDVLDYIPTQYIAEYAKNLNYDGIAFKSSLYQDLKATDDTGVSPANIVLFNYHKSAAVSSNVYKITEHSMTCEQVDDAAVREDIAGPVIG